MTPKRRVTGGEWKRFNSALRGRFAPYRTNRPMTETENSL